MAAITRPAPAAAGPAAPAAACTCPPGRPGGDAARAVPGAGHPASAPAHPRPHRAPARPGARFRATTAQAAASLPRDFAPGGAAAPAEDRPAGPQGRRSTGEGA
ncbi:hypothetical protein B6R96_06480 [Streptomyces sp. Sge12]|nr:hypothetical protein B6R96_06480 [Streptomyces sp. Sge12]